MRIVGLMEPESEMNEYRIEFPSDFDDRAGEVVSKGWYPVRVVLSGEPYDITFYDPVRLRQEITDAHERGEFFWEENLVVIKSVERSQMEKAVRHIAGSRHVRLVRSAERDG
jgi:hypothetical protein